MTGSTYCEPTYLGDRRRHLGLLNPFSLPFPDGDEALVEPELSGLMPRGHGAQDPAGGLDGGIGVIDIVVDDEDAQGGCEVSHLVYGVSPGRGMDAERHKPVDRGDPEVPRGRAGAFALPRQNPEIHLV
nr:hypothetical protein [Ruegeria atlantica]